MKIYVFWSIWKWAWQNGSTAPPGHSPYVCTQPLRLPWTDLHQNRNTGVSWPDTQKSLKGHYENLNRKSAILHLVAILAIFNMFLLWCTCPRAFIRSTSNLDDSHLNKLEMKTTSKIDFPSHGVTVGWPQSLGNAIKTRGSVSRTYTVQSSPNFTCKTRVPAWWALHRNYYIKSQRPLVETGNVLTLHVFLMHFAWTKTVPNFAGCFTICSSKDFSHSHFIMVTAPTFARSPYVCPGPIFTKIETHCDISSNHFAFSVNIEVSQGEGSSLAKGHGVMLS